MASSGLTSFNLDIDTVLLDAIDQAGGQPILGYTPRMGRRCLNLLLVEWENRQVALWKVPSAPVVQNLTAGTATYTLDSSYIDIIEAVLRTTDGTTSDLGLERLGMEDYLLIPNKTQQGRPTNYFVNRQKDAITVTTWLVANASSTYQLVYWPFARLEDVTSPTQNADVPYRFLPALTTGLAYYLGKRRPGFPEDKLARLKGEYEEQFNWACEEDRERVDMKVLPKVRRLGG